MNQVLGVNFASIDPRFLDQFEPLIPDKSVWSLVGTDTFLQMNYLFAKKKIAGKLPGKF
jgi:hypothetical protein